MSTKKKEIFFFMAQIVLMIAVIAGIFFYVGVCQAILPGFLGRYCIFYLVAALFAATKTVKAVQEKNIVNEDKLHYYTHPV